MAEKPWQGKLTGRQVLRVSKEQAKRHDNDTRHLTRAELNSELAAVARELYPAKYSE
jgi:hypothetical protein